MKNDPESIVEAFYAAWSIGDLEAVMSFIADDFRFAQHYSDPTLPFTGETVGKEATRRRLSMVVAEWKFLKLAPSLAVSAGEIVRTSCPFSVQHLASGEVFDGTFRHVWVVRDGQLAAVDEYLDVERLRSFLRLLKAPV